MLKLVFWLLLEKPRSKLLSMQVADTLAIAISGTLYKDGTNFSDYYDVVRDPALAAVPDVHAVLCCPYSVQTEHLATYIQYTP